jgi:anti-sigma regulatory factor (Ser/Thr protein kinase)
MNPLEPASLSLYSHMDRIREIGPWLERVLNNTAAAAVAAELELPLVELISNIVRHGHAHASGRAIQLHLEHDERMVRITIQDCGRPVPPEVLNGAKAALDFDLENLDAFPSGGLGLGIVLAMVNRFEYRSYADGNITVLEKHLASHGM